MSDLTNIIGAKAKVQIHYQGTHEELAKLIAQNLALPEFWFKSDQSPPYEITALSECLGFELWLTKSNDIANCYFLEIGSSTVSVEFQNNTCDLSIWLSTYICIVCDIEAIPH